MPEYTQAYASADDVTSEKSTLNKVEDLRAKVIDISDPNILHQFASYTALFTLSALSQDDLENTTTLLNSKAHDIIVRSSGIGPTENEQRPLRPETKKIIDKNERLQGAIEKSRSTLSKNRDLYIRNVTMNSVPGLNEKRRLTSVTQIDIEIVEPSGITLLERVRAAAINNGYLDHLDAPFLLTIDFKGFDELGNVASTKDSKNMKRLIPVKLIDMQMNVTAAGTVYSVKAIPYNEFAYVNRFNYLRTGGTLTASGKKLSDVFKSLEELLRKQGEDEKEQNLCQKPDIYTITFAGRSNRAGGGADNGTEYIEDASLTFENLEQSPMRQAVVDPGTINGVVDEPVEFMKLRDGMAITKILEEIMKGHPAYSDKKFEDFQTKASKILNIAQYKGGSQEVLETAQEFYFDYFKIRASVVPIEGDFDNTRAMDRKKINFHVEPYKIHAYSLAIPGVSTGTNFKNFVFKTYNYIFTGDNVDIMDLNIDYRVAYFQARLKDFEATDDRKNRIVDGGDRKDGGVGNPKDHFGDQDFVTRHHASTAKSEGTGKTGGTPTQLDAFLDALTHPLADMVNIKMEILGDPAWISQSQFIPLNAKNFVQGTGVGTDPDIDFWRANRNRIWNDELRCYNTDVAEPIIMLKFRMPTDFNDQTGVYELQSDQSAAFSGLYRVVQVEHNFTDGKYTNSLHLTRFNNQGVDISNPIPTSSVFTKDGVSYTVLSTELKNFYSEKELVNVQSNIVSIGKKFLDLVTANVSRVKKDISNTIGKIKGFIS
tara:strand:- start:1708 stop:4011 length:2304 start_codon:yes stop_codon:yes gene_type:complete